MNPETKVFKSRLCVGPVELFLTTCWSDEPREVTGIDPPFRAICTHSCFLEKLFLGVQPTHSLWILRKKEENKDATDDRWCTFNNEEPSPGLETADKVHVSNTICNSTAEGTGKSRTAEEASDSSCPLMRTIPEAEVENHTRKDSSLGRPEKEPKNSDGGNAFRARDASTECSKGED